MNNISIQSILQMPIVNQMFSIYLIYCAIIISIIMFIVGPIIYRTYSDGYDNYISLQEEGYDLDSPLFVLKPNRVNSCTYIFDKNYNTVMMEQKEYAFLQHRSQVPCITNSAEKKDLVYNNLKNTRGFTMDSMIMPYFFMIVMCAVIMLIIIHTTANNTPNRRNKLKVAAMVVVTFFSVILYFMSYTDYSHMSTRFDTDYTIRVIYHNPNTNEYIQMPYNHLGKIMHAENFDVKSIRKNYIFNLNKL